MAKQQKNIIPLYKYFAIHGFNHSMDEIAAGVQLTRKTLHNRYISRQYIHDLVVNYWKSLFITQFEEKMQFSNHALESLLILIYELELAIVNEFPIYEKESSFYQSPKSIENHFLVPIITQIIKNGQQTGDVSIDIEPKKYACYFIYIIVNMLLLSVTQEIKEENLKTKKERISKLNSSIQIEIIEFVIAPILTLKGKTKFKEIDLNLLFIVH